MIPFSLAPLRRCVPDGIVHSTDDDRLEAFLLALAVAFNDQKGLLLFREELFAHKPTDEGISANVGQWRGLELQLLRYLLAHVHELLLLIEEFSEEAQGPTIREWVKKADVTVQERWEDLVSVALNAEGTGDKMFRTTLVQIRNNAVSHYHQPKSLVAGFRRHFYTDPQTSLNEVAYVSLGKNMENTRFYYADAAVERALGTMAGKAGQEGFSKRLIKVSSNINHSLAFILRQQALRAEKK